MLNQKKIAVVLPAYNAAETLEATYREIPLEIIDAVILVDDHSDDATTQIAGRLSIDVITHRRNVGYGGNQKTCYEEALQKGADIIIMLHPDYQYSPRLLVAMAAMIAYGEYDAVLGSRIIAQSALAGGMPVYKYIFNRILTLVQNLVLGQKFSEYHTGFRAYRREILENLPLEENSNDFIFDNEMIAQMIWFGYKIGEISCPTRYTAQSSSISLIRSIQYGFGVLLVTLKYRLQKSFSANYRIFDPNKRKLQR